jgi:hypothetical protein
MQTETLQIERLVDDPEIRRAAAKTLKGFCLTYLPHHFPLELSDFFDEMCRALEDFALKRVEMIGFRGCAKSKRAITLLTWHSTFGTFGACMRVQPRSQNHGSNRS